MIINNDIAKGRSMVAKKPKLPTDPNVLKAADLAKSKGIINKPKSCKTPINSAIIAEKESIIADVKISFFEKILLIKK